jgi:hypothetical protein
MWRDQAKQGDGGNLNIRTLFITILYSLTCLLDSPNTSYNVSTIKKKKQHEIKAYAQTKVKTRKFVNSVSAITPIIMG